MRTGREGYESATAGKAPHKPAKAVKTASSLIIGIPLVWLTPAKNGPIRPMPDERYPMIYRISI